MHSPSWPTQLGYRNVIFGLERIITLLAKLGNPESKIPNILHITGTNGKGSTTSFIKAILEGNGYSVNRYTSPHLVDFNERIEICGEPISDNYLNELSHRCKLANGDSQITYFEGITAMAFLAFSEHPADYTIIEVGCGGRFDATNAIPPPLACIFTPISLDHTNWLGDTVNQIAEEKKGIIKEGSLVISSPRNKDLIDAIYSKDISTLTPKLLGAYQLHNLALAEKVIETILPNLIVTQEVVDKTKWLGRMQQLSPELFVDGSHNPDGANAILEFVDSDTILIIAMGREKSAKEFIEILATKKPKFCFVDFDSEVPFFKKEELAQIVSGTIYDSWESALKDNKAAKKIIITGSLYLAGEVLSKKQVKKS
jgi:dihydrofolate synthase / folylpolyglutamate synthase